MRRSTAWSAAFVVAAIGAATPAAARGPLVCIAASKETDAKVPITDVGSLEFYADEGDPLKSYSVPLTRVQSDPDSKGRMHNTYSVHNPNAVSSCSCGTSFDSGDDAGQAKGCGCGH